MANYYCQNSSSNIDAANNWNDVPAGGGNVLTWPPASGDNLYANGKTNITINVDFNIGTGRLSTEAGPAPGTVGGTFITSANRVLTCHIYAGSTYGVTVGGDTTFSITGDIFGGGSTNAGGITVGSTSTVTHTGNATGGTGTQAPGIWNGSSSTGTTSGTVTGGSGDTASGIWNRSSGAWSVVNATGGTHINAPGVKSDGSAAVTVTGNIISTAQCLGVAGRITHSPAAATNYIQVSSTVKYYPSTNQPDPKYVYAKAGVYVGDGATSGTLRASTIATAKGSDSNLSAGILLTGNTVDNVVGSASGGGGIFMPTAKQIGV